MLHPFLVITIRVIFVRMRTTAFVACFARVHGAQRHSAPGSLSSSASTRSEFQISERSWTLKSVIFAVHIIKLLDAFLQNFRSPENCRIVLHDTLQFIANYRRRYVRHLAWRTLSKRARALSADACQIGWNVAPGFTSSAARIAAARPNTTKSNNELVPKRLAPWTEADAHSPIAIRPGLTRIRLVCSWGNHLAAIVCRHAAHVVVHSWKHSERFFRRINTRENTRRFGNTRKTFIQHFTDQDAQDAGRYDHRIGQHRGLHEFQASLRVIQHLYWPDLWPLVHNAP